MGVSRHQNRAPRDHQTHAIAAETRRRAESTLRIVFVVMVAFVASLVGSAFAHYMVPATVDNGTFEDGYMARYMFEVGAVAFVVAAMLTRRMFRALRSAYVRRLDANGEGDSHGDDAHEGDGRE